MVQQYLDLMADILRCGEKKPSRPGVDTLSVFGRQMRFDLAAGFPMVTTRKISFKTVVVEMLWFLRGEGNTKFLTDNGVKIWSRWADENGDLKRIYGVQWRNWRSWGYESDVRWTGWTDQILSVIGSLKADPYGRRHIVTAWNPGELKDMALPPCHMLFQFNVRPCWCCDGSGQLDNIGDCTFCNGKGRILDCLLNMR